MPIKSIVIHYESLENDKVRWRECDAMIERLKRRQYRVVLLSNQLMAQDIKRSLGHATEVYGKEHYHNTQTWTQFVKIYAANNQPSSVLFIGTKEQRESMQDDFPHIWDTPELNLAYFDRTVMYADTFNYHETRAANPKKFIGIRLFGKGFGVPRGEKLSAAEKMMDYAKNPTPILRAEVSELRAIKQGKLSDISRRYGLI